MSATDPAREPTREPTEDPLLELRRGRAEPFEAYVRAHAGWLALFFRRRGVSADRAADLTQEVFVRLCRAKNHYEARERFDAYASRVASHVWIDHCRRAGVQGRQRPLDAAAERATVELELGAELERAELGTRLRCALAELGDDHRRTLELALLEELPYAEVAARLGIPVGTVKSRVFHALAKLRALLEEDEGSR
jgi:RNA polymerase sigma-70 factor (ECF subfamily)